MPLKTQTLSATQLTALENLLRPEAVQTSPDFKQNYGGDWTKAHARAPSCIVFPRSTAEVSAVMAYATSEKLRVVPSGGRTGLAGGAVASSGELVLSLEKLNKIIALDPIGLTLETEAGVTTQALQEAARAAGLFFPLDLAAKGSSHIGGNIATNAGGLKFIRYGGAREQILGLEVVLASGEILPLNCKVRKNNTGYDLKQLFIGSEGTLGIITKATLQLQPQPHNTRLCCLGLASMQHILELLQACHQARLRLTACEYFTAATLAYVLKYHPQLKAPFASQHPYYVLLESEQTGREELETFLGDLYEKGLILDGMLPDSADEVRRVWALRENITESLAATGQVWKNDLTLPIAKLATFEEGLKKITATAAAKPAALPIEIVTFGHVGDGNVHINYLSHGKFTSSTFIAAAQALETQVFTWVQELQGSISAEHGIGLIKKEALGFSRSPTEVALMRQIKRVLDPQGLLNPGKIFD